MRVIVVRCGDDREKKLDDTIANLHYEYDDGTEVCQGLREFIQSTERRITGVIPEKIAALKRARVRGRTTRQDYIGLMVFQRNIEESGI